MATSSLPALMEQGD
uniref:Uncharacterized protein n=1 Tax=Arundo donax TaxID=35708 RepID=A0A0A9BWY5_ARUDO